MAHKTLIGGTSYNVVGGKSLVSGTNYNIAKGRTLISGTGYDISFVPPSCTSYAMLYSDGDFIFQVGNNVAEGKTLVSSYKDYESKSYSEPKSVPWYSQMNNIQNVIIKDNISPTSLAFWFGEAANLKTVNINGLNWNNVTNMLYTYSCCYNLTGSPVCGANVTNMSSTYRDCTNLTGTPVCGDKVTDMYRTYQGCHNLTGSPVCGANVTNMFYTYYNCTNLTGTPVCGDKVTDMYRTYYNCRNLTGSPVCGVNVTDMTNTYYNCTNLTGSPVCGANVTDMSSTYRDCTNLTGTPVCGANVTNMTNTYYNCTNLTGSPVCGANVTNMFYTYYNCRNLTGSPVCGVNVTDMYKTYEGCHNLTGSPVCGDKVTGMDSTYEDCRNLTGSPVCGDNVIDMYRTYCGCTNLTGSPVCGDKVTYMYRTYYNCTNLTGTAVCGANVTNMADAYYNCCNITNIIIHPLTPPTISTNTFYNIPTSVLIYVHVPALSNYKTAPIWNTYADRLRPIEGIYINDVSNQVYLFNNTSSFTIEYLNCTDNEPAVTVTSSNDSVVSVSDISINNSNIYFTTNTHSIEDTATITVTLIAGELSYSTSFDINVLAEVPSCGYTVESIEEAAYGFALNSNEYYESSNAGVNNSYSICKLNITSDGIHNLYLDCINSGENNYDFGILSNVDTTLTLSSSVDSSNVFKSFKGLSSTSVQTVDYGVLSMGEHYIYIKYRKDSSGHDGNDSLQFKVRFEYI